MTNSVFLAFDAGATGYGAAGGFSATGAGFGTPQAGAGYGPAGAGGFGAGAGSFALCSVLAGLHADPFVSARWTLRASLPLLVSYSAVLHVLLVS